MKYIELFAGIGGFRFGLKKANDTITERTQQGIQQGSRSNTTIIKSFLGTKQFTCVWANEWDKYACQIYRKNFGDKELIEGDIRKITAESIPNHDLLIAGFPCQSFSIAGKRKGFGDTRGTLFFEICRIVEAKKPNLLFLENVKGLLNHDGGNTFRIILNSLSELGYDCEWEVLNSKNFGVPQNRERVFIVGHFRGKGGRKVFPIGKTTRGTIKVCARGKHQQDIVYDTSGILNLPAGTHGSTPHLTKIINGGQAYRVYNKNGISPTVPTPSGGHHIPQIIANCVTPDAYLQRGERKRINGKAVLTSCYERRIRRLTPIECERLQGFPDGWTEGISDTQRYKCLGNAVTTNVITEIGKKILQRG